MKPAAYAALFLGLVSAALGQTATLAPSPTESVGCTAHGDHWCVPASHVAVCGYRTHVSGTATALV